MDLNRKDMLIAVGVTVGLAMLVLFMKHNSAGGGGGSTGTDTSQIMGGFTSASTVFVPTSSYDLNYNTFKGPVSYSTVNQDTTTTYGPINPVPGTPSIGGSVSVVVNPPTQQTGTAPTLSAPTAPADNVHHWGWSGQANDPGWGYALIQGQHVPTPSNGWDPNSVVDNLKAHGYDSSMEARQKLAAAMAIPNYTGTAQQNVAMLNALNRASL